MNIALFDTAAFFWRIKRGSLYTQKKAEVSKRSLWAYFGYLDQRVTFCLKAR
jgi:hypothetical protein